MTEAPSRIGITGRNSFMTLMRITLDYTDRCTLGSSDAPVNENVNRSV